MSRRPPPSGRAAPALPDRARAGARSVKSSRSVNYATSPLLATPTPPWRSRLVVGFVGIGFAVLLGRAAWIQIVDAPFFLAQGEARYVHTIAQQASRGRIVDRNGHPLAVSLPAASIWAIPKDLDGTSASRAPLARALGMTPAELETRLAGHSNFVWLRRQVDDATAKRVRALAVRGVHELGEYKRHYPEGEAAAQLVGFTDVEDRGQEGIELANERDLAGRDGSRRVIKDRLGRVVEDTGESVASIDGRDVALSIDSRIQFFAFQKIRDAVVANKAKAGTVVVLDAKTGETLALANVPTFSPGDRARLAGAQLRNRALTDTFEPGSTMKPFIAAWSIETGRVRPDTVLATAGGRMTVTGSTITDAHPHGNLTVAQVIQKSSNVGAVKMALEFKPREMWELYGALGFGQKPQLGFPGVVSGRLRPWKSWRPIEQATMSYGYGLSASLFQIAHAYTVFAGDGALVPVTLTVPSPSAPATGSAAAATVGEVGAAAGAAHAAGGVRVLSPSTAAALRDMLWSVTQPGGTAQKAQVPGYSVGGKSGTAYKQEGASYATKKYRSWFVGLAPISNPRIVVAVMVDEPTAGKYYGGDVAAPVFSEVVKETLRMLGVAPDLDVKPGYVAHGVPDEPESF